MGTPVKGQNPCFSGVNSAVPLTAHGTGNAGSESLYIYALPVLNFNLFLAVLGLHCCMRIFSSCGRWGLLSSCDTQASHCSGFSCCKVWALEHRLNSCGAHALLLHGMCDLPV